MSETGKPRRRRWPWIGATMLALLAAAGGGTWWFHEEIVQRLASRALGADVVISGLHWGSHPGWDYLGLSDIDESRGPVFLSMEEVSLTPSSGSDTGRWFESLNIGRMTINATATPQSNHDFVLEILTTPKSAFDPLPYVPKSVDAAGLSLAYETERAGFRLNGLRIDSEILNLSDFNLKISGESVSGSWWAEELVQGSTQVDGSFELVATMDGSAATMQLGASMPGFLDVAMAGSARLKDTPTYKLELSQASLDGEVWGQMVTDRIGYPLGFERLTVSDGKLRAERSDAGLKVPEISIRLASDRIWIGEREAPQFEGPAELSIQGESDSNLAATLQLQLEGMPEIGIAVAGEPGGYRVQLLESSWSREALSRIVPADLGFALEAWPGLQGLKWQGQGLLGGDEPFMVDAAVSGLDGATTQLNAEITQIETGDPGIEVMAVLPEAGSVQVNSPPPIDASRGIDIGLDKARLDRWVAGVLGHPWSLGSGIEVTGGATYRLAGEGGLNAIDLSLEGPVIVTDGGDAGNLKTALHARHDLDKQIVDAIEWGLSIGEALEFEVKSGTTRLSPFSARLPITGVIDLGVLGTLMQTSYGSGTAQFSGDLMVADGAFTLSRGKVGLEGLTIGSVTMPETPPIEWTGQGSWSGSNGLVFPEFKVAWGDTLQGAGTGLQVLGSDRWSAEHLKLSGTYALLETLGIFETADTRFLLETHAFRKDGEEYAGTVQGNLDGGFVLPDDLVAATGVTMAIEGNLASGLGAKGTFKADELAAFGAKFSEVISQLNLAWPVLSFSESQSRLFGGDLKGSGKVDLSDPLYPVTMDAEITNADLAEFTAEFKPPDTELTGLVSGTVHAALRGKEITELDVHLTSGEGFTLNRAMVAQILMSQQVGDITGSGTVSKIVERVIGTEDARPFTGAELILGIDSGRITGQALLKSKALNLTVDIKADQKALFEALRMRQEGQVAGFETTLQ